MASLMAATLNPSHQPNQRLESKASQPCGVNTATCSQCGGFLTSSLHPQNQRTYLLLVLHKQSLNTLQTAVFRCYVPCRPSSCGRQ